MPLKKRAPSLVDLCVRTAIDNLRYLGDVGETDTDLLDQILPHCTLDQLMHIEKSSKGRDLSPVTDKLWKKFYEKEFGVENTSLLIERMKKKKVSYRWIQLYEAKLKDVEEAQEQSLNRISQLYKMGDAEKQKRQTQVCNKIPPSSNKRGFWSCSGPGYNVGNGKSNILKKAKKEFLKSPEVKNLTALKKNAVPRNYSASPVTRRSGFSNGSASCSKQIKPPQRRYLDL